MDVADTRRKNLQACLDGEFFAGNQSKLAEKIGKAPRYVNALIRGKKSFGERAARHIEECLRLPTGSLDRAADGELRAAVTKVKAAGTWPFSIDRERFEALSATGKQQIEGAMRLLLVELEADALASGKKRSGKRRGT